MIQTQSELANIQVALGGSTEQLNTIFEESARVADLTSSSTMGVLEGYALAYRAAGSIADENERLLVSNNLLAESMTLAKLAGIDQARAMDILVGALRQTGRELTEGRDLIDKWVYISRIANVSLETLAETYSIVGSSAEGVGISMEQLNALTATLAESTGLSASETGNAIRGIIAGFQSASAEQALGRFGIATRSATGELRDFYELYLEIAELTQSGILSERDISEIANAIGGGYRRGAQVQVLLENSNRTRQLEADQTYAGGAAAEALGIQMQTLESAITRLGNAFTKFAQTLGSEGGFASIITVLVNGLTEMLDLITAIATGMGKATPVILAYAAAWAFLNSTRGQAFLSTQNLPGLTGLAGKFGKLTDEQIISQRLAQVTGNTPRMGAGAAVGALGRRTGITAMGALGYGIAGINVAGAAAEGITSGEGLEKAGVAIVGSIIGGLIGSATIVGAPVGAAIGSMAATSLYEGIQTDSTKFRQLWADILAIPEPGKPGEEPPVDELASAVDQIGLIPKALAGIFSFIGNAAGVKPIGGQKLTPEVLLTGWATGETGRLPVPPEIAQAITEAINNQIQQAFEEGTEKGTLGIQAEGRIPELASSISGVVNDFMADQLNQLVLGEVSLEQLRGLTTEIDPTKIATQLSNVMGALDFTGMSRDTQELAKFMLELDDATRLYASTLGADVIRLQDAYNNALDTGTIEEQTKAQEALNDATARFKSVFPALELQRRVATVDRSQVFDVGKATPQQVQMAVSLAQQFQKAYFLALADGNEELAAIMEQQVEPILLKYGEGLGQRFGEKVAVGSQFMTEAFKELDIQTTMPKFGFQDLRKDLGMEDLPGLMRRYQKVVGSFQQNFPDYKLEETDVGLITKNGMQTVHADLSLLNLAMQDLIDVNEQQLEGVWNLPSGMTAFVAWSSLFSRNMPAGGTSTNFEDVFNKDRMDELAKATQPDQASIEQELTRLNEAIAAMERVLSLPAQQVGMQERLAMRGELETTKGKRDELTQQLQAMQLSQTLGIQQQPGTSVVDQLREALTVQSKIELNANIRLVVDGRTLANIVKQYLFEDLTSAANKSAGTGGGQYVVGH
jgi:TP901 family phage tail tape measure protein